MNKAPITGAKQAAANAATCIDLSFLDRLEIEKRDLGCVALFNHDDSDARQLGFVGQHTDESDGSSTGNVEIVLDPPVAPSTQSKDLEAGRVAHLITITSEMIQALSDNYVPHHREHGLDVRLNLASAKAFPAADYVQAQQVCTRLITNFNRALEQVDAIITPTTGLTAPIIPKAALSSGESDLATMTEIMRFVTPANLTGLPAISFPVGYDDEGLPIGMQAIGRAWQEHTLLRLAQRAEGFVERKPPRVHYRILPE